MPELNVLGERLQTCGTEPMTGFFRDGCCHTGPQDLGSHTICAVVTAEFLEHQRSVGNDLVTPVPMEVLSEHAVDVPADPGQLSS